MKPRSGPGLLDVMVVVLSPVIIAGLTVIFLVCWWFTAAWLWFKGRP